MTSNRNPNSLNNFAATSANWRKTLRQNSNRTYIVIGLFFLIYLCIGLLVDMFVIAERYPQANINQIVHALATLQIFPLATTIMLIIAAVSLLASYAMYDKLMLLGTEYKEITPAAKNSPEEQLLYNVIEEMKIAAGLHYMPKVYIINADYMNAFASGYSEKSAMVAITRGLMEKLTRDELQAVMAHELSHIRHLDIKLTLTASLLANITIIVLDIFFRGILYNPQGRGGSKSRNNLVTIIIVLRFVLPVITMLLLLYLSRTREIMADAGAVELTRTNQPLATALLKINDDHAQNQDKYNAAYSATPHEEVRRSSYIFDPTDAGIKSMVSLNDFLSTHPSLQTRLAMLGFKKKE